MGEKGVRGKGGKEEKPDSHRQGHAVFFLRPALALSFVDSGSGMGPAANYGSSDIANGTLVDIECRAGEKGTHSGTNE